MSPPQRARAEGRPLKAVSIGYRDVYSEDQGRSMQGGAQAIFIHPPARF